MRIERSRDQSTQGPTAHVKQLRLYPKRTGELLKDFRQENQWLTFSTLENKQIGLCISVALNQGSSNYGPRPVFV